MDQTIQDQSNNSSPKAGKAGRPKGSRNRVSREVKEIALRKGPKMLRLLETLAEKAKDERTQLAAVTEYLNRAYGKPISPTEISGPDGAPVETKDVSKIEVSRRILNMIAEAKEASAGPRPIATDPVGIEARRALAFGLTLAAREAAKHDGEPMPTWHFAPFAREADEKSTIRNVDGGNLKPAQVIPPAAPSYVYEPTPDELAQREFDAHINRASNRAIGVGGSRPNIITQRPR
ncbi:hypothetical protein [Sphingosinicella soli]|uniref:Uncharacterized protein n=1 Tax=Sphingosinicella soli TaxID=333708 RepID=A0A7W7F8L5_9SPHN|nr:hypothetical protein [Sphingosinicella soli]MBB4633772.1 hypothetical protein [Sphingosinicella soli]